MPDYTPTDARRDAGRFISDNLFTVRVDYNDMLGAKNIWLIAAGFNESDVIKKTESWADKKGLLVSWIEVFPTLNAIEETIK